MQSTKECRRSEVLGEACPRPQRAFQSTRAVLQRCGWLWRSPRECEPAHILSPFLQSKQADTQVFQTENSYAGRQHGPRQLRSLLSQVPNHEKCFDIHFMVISRNFLSRGLVLFHICMHAHIHTQHICISFSQS